MKIPVIELKISKKYEIDIPGDTDYVYGVETAENIFCRTIGDNNIEHIAGLCLDSTNKVINYALISMGNIDNVKVPLAQLVKVALLSNASKIIIAHNHPSGVLEINSMDIDMTKKIASLLHYLEIELIDSLVVNGEKALSIRENAGEIGNV